MKRTIQSVLLAGSLAVGSAAFAQSDTGAEKMQGQAQKMEGKAEKGMKQASKDMKGMAQHMDFAIPTDPKAFLERLHHTNQSEIKEAQLAQQNSQNADVKTYAQQMITEHTAADQKLMAYAKSKNLKLADMPKPMNDMERKGMAAHKATMEALKEMKGMPFDSKYLSGQVAAHDMAIGKVMAAQAEMKGADAEMTAMLSELSQKLPHHREMAYSALGKLAQQMKSHMGATGGSGESETTAPTDATAPAPAPSTGGGSTDPN
jgi:putative membrane protein